MGSRERRFILEAKPLGWHVGGRRSHRCCALRPNSIRTKISNANSTGKHANHDVELCATNRLFSRQGGHIKIHLHSDIPVQVDGEPWVQSPGDVVVLKSALKVSFLLFELNSLSIFILSEVEIVLLECFLFSS